MSETAKDKWFKIRELVQNRLGKTPDINGLLFVIGIRELGSTQSAFTKEEKVKLFDLAVRRLLSTSGYYELEGQDPKGWPVYREVSKIPFQNIFEQEMLLRHHIIDYFESEELI